ncbi:MAG: SDR family oxidoreductase [Chitinophagales bacterium]
MQGKIAIVTGGNAGIGKQTAIGLAKKGATLVLFCRNEEKGKTAQKEIKTQTGNQSIDLIQCDLSSLQSVKKAATEFQNKYDKLDILINNAGLFFDRLSHTSDGFETQFQVNHLSHFYLTSLLLGLLKKSNSARIVNVSSAAHRGRKIDFENLVYGKEKYDGLDVYGQTKLANVLFTYELSRRFAAQGISSFALHPGVVRTKIGQKHTKGWVNWGWKLLTSLPIFSISEQKGAATSLYAATSPTLQGISGKYLKDCKIIKSTKQSYDEQTAKKLWELSESLLKKKTM